MKLGTDGVMNECRQMQERIDALQKENAELRECLESCMNAMCQFCREACPGVVCFHGCEYMTRAKKALESEDNHE